MHPRGLRGSSSHTPGIIGRRALPAWRLARLGATPDFHHGLLRARSDMTAPFWPPMHLASTPPRKPRAAGTPGPGGVARRLHTPGMRAPRALPGRRLNAQNGTVMSDRVLGEPHTERVPASRPSTPRGELNALLRRRSPTVHGTHALLARNLIPFAAVAVASESMISLPPRHLTARGADFGPRTTNGQRWRLFTSTFLHSGLLHLSLNLTGLPMSRAVRAPVAT